MYKSGQSSIYVSSIAPLRFVFVMWLLFTLDFVYGYHFSQYGILPRNIYGLTGVITAPLLHKGISHIVSNTFPLIFLGTALFYLHPKVAKRVFYGSYLMANIIVWFFGRPLMHIGASGLIYAIAFFIVVSGLLSKKVIPTIVSLMVLVGYSGLIYGLIPSNYLYSWEMHIAGAATGLGFAIYYKLNKAIM